MPEPNHPLIVLVDEDDVVRDSLKLLLESHDLPVRDFRHAHDFLAGETDSAACVVIGLNRAIDDGLELLAALGRRGLDLPVIFVVGNCGATQKLAALRAGACAYLERPAGEAALVQTIKAAMAGRGAGAAPDLQSRGDKPASADGR